MTEEEVKKVSRDTQTKHKGNFLDKDGQLYIVNCASCHKENWGPAVASGCCAWCGWGMDQ